MKRRMHSEQKKCPHFPRSVVRHSSLQIGQRKVWSIFRSGGADVPHSAGSSSSSELDDESSSKSSSESLLTTMASSTTLIVPRKLCSQCYMYLGKVLLNHRRHIGVYDKWCHFLEANIGVNGATVNFVKQEPCCVGLRQ